MVPGSVSTPPARPTWSGPSLILHRRARPTRRPPRPPSSPERSVRRVPTTHPTGRLHPSRHRRPKGSVSAPHPSCRRARWIRPPRRRRSSRHCPNGPRSAAIRVRRETKAPVAVQPMEEAPAQAASGQSAASGKHGLWFGIDAHRPYRPTRRRSTGGGPGPQQRHRGRRSRHEGAGRSAGVGADRTADGSTWTSAGRRSSSSNVGPAQAPRLHRGPAEVEVAAWSSSNPQVRCADHLRLEVGAYHDLEVGPDPERSHRSPRRRVQVGLTE